MPITGDQQEMLIVEAAEIISQQRAAAQQAAQRLTQAQTVLAGLSAKYESAIQDATGVYAERWQALIDAFQELKPVIDAAVARSEVQALRDLEV